jgi:hypothetical protein
MNRIDTYLVIAALGLYLLECVHFLRGSEVAYTGFLRGQAKEWKLSPLSYTLLGFHVCVLNPFATGTGFIKFSGSICFDLPEVQAHLSDETKRLGFFLLETLTSILAALILIALPIIVFLHYFSSLWAPITIEILLTHFVVCAIFALELKRLMPRSTERTSKVLAVCLNPLASIRCIDVLSEAIILSGRWTKEVLHPLDEPPEELSVD